MMLIYMTRRYRSLLALPLMFCTTNATAFELQDFFKRSDQRAIELLENGEVEAAASEFKDPQWRGVSRYKAGLYEEAMQDFSTAEDAEGLYNHGTAAARTGDYTQALTSLTQALELAPQDTNIAHNLEVVKKLKELADSQQEQSQQNPSQDEQGEQQESDPADNNDDSGESQQQGQQPGSESDQNQQPSESSDDNSGKSDTDENHQTDEVPQQEAEALRDMMQQQQGEQQNETQEPQPPMTAAPDPVSEDDQATEQWLRRIPDDASQLLRNKIRLNHLIEHPNLDDMQEPW